MFQIIFYSVVSDCHPHVHDGIDGMSGGISKRSTLMHGRTAGERYGRSIENAEHYLYEIRFNKF